MDTNTFIQNRQAHVTIAGLNLIFRKATNTDLATRGFLPLTLVAMLDKSEELKEITTLDVAKDYAKYTTAMSDYYSYLVKVCTSCLVSPKGFDFSYLETSELEQCMTAITGETSRNREDLKSASPESTEQIPLI